MDKLKIRGGRRLVGEVRISGAKNAALPILAASLLTAGDLVLHNVPELADVRTMLRLLEGMGVRVERSGSDVTLNASNVTSTVAPYELVKTMRASILTLCPLAARFGSATVSLPGGCAIGARPVDQHIKGLRKLGAEVEVEHGYVQARAGRLKGARIVTDMVTVTGTENLLMAAVLAEGRTVIENAAREPEVVDLARCLNAMGAKITGIGTPTLVVDGVESLQGAEYSVVPDRIEAGSFLCAAAATRGDVLVTHCVPSDMEAMLAKLREMGAELEIGSDWIRLRQKDRPNPVQIRTAPHPAFPTDMQAQFMAVCTLAVGTSLITETIFENRFMHVPELQRLGARIDIDGHTAAVRGVERLTCARAPRSSSPPSPLRARARSTGSIILTAATSAWQRSSEGLAPTLSACMIKKEWRRTPILRHNFAHRQFNRLEHARSRLHFLQNRQGRDPGGQGL